MIRKTKYMFVTMLFLQSFISYITQAQTTLPKPELRIGVINSQLFEDSKEGIYKLTQLQQQVRQEFQARSLEIEQQQKKAKALEDQLKKAAGKADQNQYYAYEDLQKQIKNKSDDLVRQSQKRYTELLTPLQTKMATVFKEWCQKNGYYLLLDIAKDPNGMVLLADEKEVQKNTADLIRYMNTLL